MTPPVAIGFLILLVGAALALAPQRYVRGAALWSIALSGCAFLWHSASAPRSWWSTDPIGLFLAMGTLTIGLCVCAYTWRQFDGEQRGGPLLSASIIVIASVIATDFAATFAALALSWTVTSLSTIMLLGLGAGWRRHAPARRAAVTFAIADCTLVIGFVVATSLSRLSLAAPLDLRVAGAGAVVALVAAVIAAVLRAGMGAGRSWVSATVNAPTSISALLHAGVVNAGALLLIRVQAVTGSGPLFGVLLSSLCAAQLLVLAPRIHARVDLKGQLATSTIAQMAFMLLALALGWPALALTHLFGHGLYKAGRFMASAGAVETRARFRRRQPRGSQLGVGTRAMSALLLLVGCLSIGAGVGGDVLAVSAVLAPAVVVIWWTRTAVAVRAAITFWIGLLSAALVYELIVWVVTTTLAETVPSGAWRAPWWTLGVATVAIAALNRVRQNGAASDLYVIESNTRSRPRVAVAA